MRYDSICLREALQCLALLLCIWTLVLLLVLDMHVIWLLHLAMQHSLLNACDCWLLLLLLVLLLVLLTTLTACRGSLRNYPGHALLGLHSLKYT
jgi:hypothetical protein